MVTLLDLSQTEKSSVHVAVNTVEVVYYTMMKYFKLSCIYLEIEKLSAILELI